MSWSEGRRPASVFTVAHRVAIPRSDPKRPMSLGQMSDLVESARQMEAPLDAVFGQDPVHMWVSWETTSVVSLPQPSGPDIVVDSDPSVLDAPFQGPV